MSLLDSLPSSSSAPPVIREEGYIRFEHGRDHSSDHRDRPPWNRSEYDYRNGSIVASENARNHSTSEDPWSCVVVVATFSLFVSMTLILGLYGTTNVWLGPNSSFLIQPASIFVQNVFVEELGKNGSGMMLYGLNQAPELNVVANWSEVHYLAVPDDSYKYWIQYLNKGSRVKVSYNIESAGSSLYLVIAQGVDGLSEWVQDPTRPDSTLSWHLIYDSGVIEQDITKSSSYYIAVGNVYLNEVKATFNIQVEAVLYDTTKAYYNCSFPKEKCTLSVPLFGTNAAVLTSPGPKLNNSKNEFCAKISYEPRWIAYIACMGVVTVLLLVAFGLFNKRQLVSVDETMDENEDVAPLIPGKDDDNSSWCSSYSSILTSNEEIEGAHDLETYSSTRYRCAICFDASRDCFFLSCGHCVACFQCGTRVAETSGFCPVCRKKIRKRQRHKCVNNYQSLCSVMNSMERFGGGNVMNTRNTKVSSFIPRSNPRCAASGPMSSTSEIDFKPGFSYGLPLQTLFRGLNRPLRNEGSASSKLSTMARLRVLAFLNAVLGRNQLNKVVDIANGYSSCDYIYDSFLTSHLVLWLEKFEDFVTKNEDLSNEELYGAQNSAFLQQASYITSGVYHKEMHLFTRNAQRVWIRTKLSLL